MNKTALKQYAPLAVLVLLLVLPHVAFFGNGYVDMEKYMAGAARDTVQNGSNANLYDYFTMVMNPVFSVWLLAGSYTLFGESPAVSRMTIFAVAFAFCLFAYFFLRKRSGPSIAFVAMLLVAVNPMFIIYSQYVYSDVPFMVFITLALLLMLYGGTTRESVASALVLGVALATKYITVALYPLALIFSIIKSGILRRYSSAALKSLVWSNLWYYVVSFAISVPVLLIVFRYRSSVAPPGFDWILSPSASLYIPRVFSYLLWTGFFVGPSCLILIPHLWRRLDKSRFLLLIAASAALTLLVTHFFSITSLHVADAQFGEMNLSWAESVVPPSVLSVTFFFIILVGELFVASFAVDSFRGEGERTVELFLWFILTILIFSLTRVANRYMLAVLMPMSLYMAVVVRRMYSGRGKAYVTAVLALHIIMFLAVGVYSNSYLHLRGLG